MSTGHCSSKNGSAGKRNSCAFLLTIFSSFISFIWAAVFVSPSSAQNKSDHTDKSAMHQHYDAAYRFQSAGDFQHADAEHTLFLVAALDHLANFHANIGDYAHAATSYNEALALIPTDFNAVIDYAGAALDAHDPKKAKSLLQIFVNSGSPSLSDGQKAEVHRLFGTALRELDDSKGAVDHLQQAVALNPDIENLCALGNTILGIDSKKAAAIFAKVVTKYGDTAAVHMRIGRIYALGGSPDEAVNEFKKAIAENPKMAGTHYSLGAAYMTSSKRDFAGAETEFRKELALHPSDTLSYPQLGYIALTRHDYHSAEINFKRAIALNPLAADNYMQLGKLYMETRHDDEAEAAFRKAIDLTVDPASNSYEIERAHYRLGRLLMERGNKSEAEKELKISQDLLTERDRESAAKLNGEEVQRNPLEKTKVATPEEMEELKLFKKQASPLIAASYNNLGVHSAMANDFSRATRYFQLAAKWNPALPGVDANWGRAAFAAHDCAEAMVPLRKFLESHPSDSETQAMLDQCSASIRRLRIIPITTSMPDPAFRLFRNGEFHASILLGFIAE
jgi:tetratricopeptide (TPR) repeat protein